MTTLTVRDLWDDPVAKLLQQWDDVRGAAGGGLGSGLPLDLSGRKRQTTTTGWVPVSVRPFFFEGVLVWTFQTKVW